MVAPLVGIAAAAAAKLVAKKLAQNAAKNTVKKTVKKLAEPKSAVKVIKGNSGPYKNVNEMIRKGFNKDADTTALRRKSGELAKTRASQVDIGKPKTTVKINSATKSAPRASRTRSGNKAK